MQTRKPDIEESILLQAETEFFRYGYERASLRRIIKASGISIGNFYNYFEGKESLFDAVVKDEYRKFISFINNHESVGSEFAGSDIKNSAEWENAPARVLAEMAPGIIKALIPDFGKRFIILIEGSRGTSYANARSQLVSVIEEHFTEHTRHDEIMIDGDFARFLAEQFLDGFISIIKSNHENTAKRNKLLADFIVFFLAGAMGFVTGK